MRSRGRSHCTGIADVNARSSSTLRARVARDGVTHGPGSIGAQRHRPRVARGARARRSLRPAFAPFLRRGYRFGVGLSRLPVVGARRRVRRTLGRRRTARESGAVRGAFRHLASAALRRDGRVRVRARRRDRRGHRDARPRGRGLPANDGAAPRGSWPGCSPASSPCTCPPATSRTSPSPRHSSRRACASRRGRGGVPTAAAILLGGGGPRAIPQFFPTGSLVLAAVGAWSLARRGADGRATPGASRSRRSEAAPSSPAVCSRWPSGRHVSRSTRRRTASSDGRACRRRFATHTSTGSCTGGRDTSSGSRSRSPRWG